MAITVEVRTNDGVDKYTFEGAVGWNVKDDGVLSVVTLTGGEKASFKRWDAAYIPSESK